MDYPDLTVDPQNGQNGLSSFPSQNVSPEEKQKIEYGISYARGIYSSILTKLTSNSDRSIIQRNRAYAMGLQDVDQYKSRLDAAIDNVGDTSYMNISWDIESPAAKFRNGVVNRILNRNTKIQLEAVDKYSYTAKQKERDKLYGKMVMNAQLKELEAQVKMKLTSSDESLPENNEDLEMYMDMGFKLPIEMGMETLIDWEMYSNNMEQEIAPRVVGDIVENGKGVIKLYFDSTGRPKIRYVDIEHYHTTYTDDPFYNDTDYDAELRMMTIKDIREVSTHLSEEDLFELARKAAGRYNNPTWAYGDIYNGSLSYNDNRYMYDDFRIMCLDFTFASVEKRKYSSYTDKYGTDRFVRVKSDWKPSKNSNVKYNIIEETNYCEYSGLWPVDTNKMIYYGKEKNMVYPIASGKRVNKPLRKYIAVEPGRRYGTNKSLIARIIPNLDNIQIAVLRMRHYIAEAVPPGIAIDISRIVDIMSTMKWDNPMDMIKLFKQKGIAVYMGTDSNGDPVNGKSVDFIENSLGDGLAQYINMIQFEMNQIREITGFNEAMDAIQPDAKALVGVQDLALISANMNMRELYEAYNYGILGRGAKTLSRMIQMFIEFGKGKEVYEPIIGKAGIDFMSFLEYCWDAELGVKITALPEGKEMQDVLMLLTKDLETGTISTDDAYDVMQLIKSNPKKAMTFLRYRKKKYAQQKMQQEKEKEMIVAQREQMAAQASAEAEAMKAQAKAQAEMMVLEKEYELKIKLKQIEIEGDKEVMKVKYQGENEKIRQAFMYKDAEPSAIEDEEEGDMVPGINDPETGINPVDAATRLD